MVEIPGYRIVRELGRGAAGSVHVAVQESLQREVALKLLSPALAADPVAAARFLREGRTLARLVHRHIVGIHDVGIHAGQPYLAMEYIPGGTVSVAGAHAPGDALDIVREIALALDHADAQGVVHRDVKPENILVRADGSRALGDFGIAHSADATVLTQEGITAGTPHYMSPEQLQGLPLDGRSDLYSLGVLFHQLLTGALPYQASDAMAVALKHLHAPIPTLPAPLARSQPVLDALMAKDPDDRPATGADVVRMLDVLRTGQSLPITRELATDGRGRFRWPPRPAVLVLAGIAALGLSWAGWRAVESRDAAGAQAAAQATVKAVAPAGPRTVAVLPLANLGADADNAFLSDGLAGTLIDVLAQVPDLRVIARSSSIALKGKAMDARAVGKSLGASHLVEGSVQQSGQRLRILVQLVRTSDGAQLWSQRYDRPVADVFDVQDDVASQVARALEIAIPAAGAPGSAVGGSGNAAAQREYLRGVELLRPRQVQPLQLAIGHFERAIELDPAFARAHAMAAAALTMLDGQVPLTPAQRNQRESLVRRALELEPQLGEAYVVRATIVRRTDPKAADRDFRRGLALAPNFAVGYSWYAAWLARNDGRVADAVPMVRKAIEIDPLDANLRVTLGFLVLALGRIDEAETIADALLREGHSDSIGHGLKAHVRRGRRDLPGELRALDAVIAANPESAGAKRARCEALRWAGAYALAETCARALPASVGEAMLSEIALMRALARGDTAAVRAITERLGNPVELVSLAARLEGRPADAVAALREAKPEWFRNPIGRPNIDREYEFIDVALALRESGDVAQAGRVLDYGRAMILARRVGSAAGGGRAWADAISLAVLGRHREACAAMQAGAEVGMYEVSDIFLYEPALRDFRREPCFELAHRRIRANGQAQVAAARAAGLL
jgi:TolB-like protein/tetratricopeptide (TPR) repeat protein